MVLLLIHPPPQKSQKKFSLAQYSQIWCHKAAVSLISFHKYPPLVAAVTLPDNETPSSRFQGGKELMEAEAQGGMRDIWE